MVHAITWMNILCGSNYMKCSKEANPQRQKLDEGLPGLGRLGIKGYIVFPKLIVVIASQLCEYTN